MMCVCVNKKKGRKQQRTTIKINIATKKRIFLNFLKKSNKKKT